MFKISPVQDANLAKEYLKSLDVEYIDGAFVYAMINLDEGSLMGISQFEIKEDFGYIFTLKPTNDADDFEAMFILGRQTMNFIDLCGTHTCKASSVAAEEKLLKAIGFKRTGEEYFCDMTGMFDGHCSGHKVELN